MLKLKFFIKNFKFVYNKFSSVLKNQLEVIQTIGKIDVYDFSSVLNVLRYFLLSPIIKFFYSAGSLKYNSFFYKPLKGSIRNKHFTDLGTLYIYKRIYRKKQRRPLRLFTLFSKLNYIRKNTLKEENYCKLFANFMILLLMSISLYVFSTQSVAIRKIYHKTYITDSYWMFDLQNNVKTEWNVMEKVFLNFIDIKAILDKITKYVNTYFIVNLVVIKNKLNFILRN